jgi:hypothetical protein
MRRPTTDKSTTSKKQHPVWKIQVPNISKSKRKSQQTLKTRFLFIFQSRTN